MARKNPLDDFTHERMVRKLWEERSFTSVPEEFGINKSVLSRAWKAFQTAAYNGILKYPIYFAYPVRFSELIGNIREFIILKKTPKNISGKVPYRFVTYSTDSINDQPSPVTNTFTKKLDNYLYYGTKHCRFKLISWLRKSTGPLRSGGSKEGIFDPVKSSLSGPSGPHAPGCPPQAPDG
ncbi:hypothetical protein TNCV_4478051 [Trichonephila clavipes]|nr:hypothetical protein TNCV_4478051 [Trichonephila clavipes]